MFASSAVKSLTHRTPKMLPWFFAVASIEDGSMVVHLFREESASDAFTFPESVDPALVWPSAIMPGQCSCVQHIIPGVPPHPTSDTER